MPIGILGSLVVCTLLYVVVSVVLTGMVSYTELNVPSPMALAMQRTGAPDWLRTRSTWARCWASPRWCWC